MSSRTWLLFPTPALLVWTCLAAAQQPESTATSYKPRTLSPAPEMQVVSPGAGTSVTQSGRGKLLVVTDTWDFGYVPQDAYVTHGYLLQNSGHDTLFIEEVKPTCGCTVASLDKKRLAPGEKVPVTITLGTQKFSGALTKKVHVMSSDKDSPRYALTFTANVGPVPGLELSSGAAIDLGRISAGDARSLKTTLTNRSGARLQVQIADAPAYLRASLSSPTLDPQASLDLSVATAAAPPEGLIKGSITLALSGGQVSRLTIPLTGVGVAP